MWRCHLRPNGRNRVFFVVLFCALTLTRGNVDADLGALSAHQNVASADPSSSATWHTSEVSHTTQSPPLGLDTSHVRFILQERNTDPLPTPNASEGETPSLSILGGGDGVQDSGSQQTSAPGEKGFASSCRSRGERHLYHNVTRYSPPPALRKKILSFSVLQQRCAQPVTNWVRLYEQRYRTAIHPGADVRGCKYLLWEEPNKKDLGSRLLSLLSAFLYAMLTQRALMVDDRSVAGQLLCGLGGGRGGWVIPQQQFRSVLELAKRHSPTAESWRGGLKEGEYSSSVLLNLTASSVSEKARAFLCPREQHLIRKTTFVAWQLEEYTVPRLMLLKKFKLEVSRLFPDGQVALPLARHLFHPNDFLWDRITRLWEHYMTRMPIRVGIQIESAHAEENSLLERVLHCATRVSKYLPPLLPGATWGAAVAPDPPGVGTSVLVSSLSITPLKQLKRAYRVGQTRGNARVIFHSESRGEPETRQQLENSIVDVWMLSFSDKLIITEGSSMGYVAAALGGIEPFELKMGFGIGVGCKKRPVEPRGASNLRQKC